MQPTRLETIKLAVVDDHTLFRQGLLKLIKLANRDSNYQILFDAGGAYDMKEKLDIRNPPDIILMDITMPDGDGFEAVHWLNQYCPGVKVLVVSMVFTEAAIIRMLKMGIKGYLSKEIEERDVYAAIDAIAKGGFYYTDYRSKNLLEIFQYEGQTVAGKPALLLNHQIAQQLNETERTFLKYVCTELTYQQISEKMNVSPKTVDDYRDKLFKKLGVKTRVTLALYAVKHELVEL